MPRSYLLNFLISTCLLLVVSPSVSQAAPQRARAAKPFADKVPSYQLLRSDRQVRKLTAKKDQLQPSDPQAIRLDTKIVREKTRGAKLRAKQASKAKQATGKLDARRAAYAAKLGTRSTERLIAEQWVARNIVSFFTPMRTYLLGASGVFSVAGALVNEPLVSMASVALLGLVVYAPAIEELISDNSFYRPLVTTKTSIAPFHAAELIKRGVVTKENTLTVKIHEEGLTN